MAKTNLEIPQDNEFSQHVAKVKAAEAKKTAKKEKSLKKVAKNKAKKEQKAIQANLKSRQDKDAARQKQAEAKKPDAKAADNNEFRQHVQKVAAKQAEKKASDNNEALEDTPEQQLVLAQLGEHQRTLGNIQSQQEKIKFKAENISEYDGYLAGVLEADEGNDNPIITTLMVWCFDIGLIEKGLELAEYALKHGLSMPDRYNRTLPTVVAEEVATASLKDIEAVKGDEILETMVMVEGHDMPDQVRAKLYKASGLLNKEVEEYQLAADDFEKAISLHDACGAKELLKQVNRALKKQAESEEKPAETSETKQQDKNDQAEESKEDKENKPG